MNLDLRLPMGMMFSILGAVLLAFGLATRTRPELYTRSFGINANLWCGSGAAPLRPDRGGHGPPRAGPHRAEKGWADRGEEDERAVRTTFNMPFPSSAYGAEDSLMP